MCDALVWLFDAITGLPWLAIMEAVALVATAVIAFLALKTWKRQDKAKRQAEFLDQLTDAAHTYIAEMSKPVTLVQFVAIAMKAHAPTWEGGDQSVKGAIAYIEKRGVDDSKRLLEALAVVQPTTIRLRSLVAKGQVFKFQDYAKCQNAIKGLTWHFDRLETLTAFISPSWNWENPEVLSLLERIVAINADDIRKSFADDNVRLIEFVAETYGRIYD
jgi:hypothetical protein